MSAEYDSPAETRAPGRSTAPLRAYLPVGLLLFAMISLLLWRLVWWRWVLFVGDTWTLYYPAKAYAASLILHGEFPLWTPNLFCGFPLFAEGQVAALYPLHLVYLIFSTPLAFNLSVLLRLFLAGFFTFLYVRRITRNDWAAAISAVTFACGGYMMAQLRHENVEHALIWLPLILFALDRWISEENRRMLALAGVCMGVSFLAGYFFISLLVLITSTAYYMAESYRVHGKGNRDQGMLRRMPLRRMGGWALFGLIGLGIGSVQLLPGYELAQESIRSGGLSYGASTQVSFSPFHLICFLIPKFFGYPMDGTVWGLWRANPADLVGYFGILPLLFAFGALLLRRDRRTLFFGGVGVGALLLAFGQFSPLWRLLHLLPVFSMMRNPARFLGIVAFSGAVLAGLGFDGLVRRIETPPSRLKRYRRFVLYGAGVFTAACAVSGPLTAGMRSPILRFGRWFVDRFVYAQSIHQQSQAYYYTLVEQYYDRLAQFAHITHPYLYVPVAFVLAGALFVLYLTQRPRNRMAAGLVSLCLLGADLILFGRSYNWIMPPEVYDQKEFYIEVMERDPSLFRYAFAPLKVSMRNYDALLFNQMYIQGYSPIEMHRHANMIKVLRPRMAALTGASSIPLIDLMNIKYIVTGDSLTQDWAITRFDEGTRVYENRDVLPRAFVVPHARFVPTPEKALKAVADPSFDPRERVVLEDDPAPEAHAAPAAPSSGYRGEARIVRYDVDEVVVDVESDGGYLVLTDTYYPGWRAEVDGRERRIIRADYLFRAVSLSAGRHHVRFRYDPLSFKLGALVSLVSLAGALGICFLHRRRPA